MTPVTRASGLAAGYEGRVVATVPNLTIAPGARVSLRGANGSGKTTVLKTLGGLLPPVSGELTAARAGRGGAIYVHPAPFLFTGTGFDNVLLGAHGARDEAEAALDALRAASFAGADVRTLSNGQRQRIALARALAARPTLLLIDEADSGLDAEGRDAWHGVLAARMEIAIVVASPHDRHDISGAQRYVLAAGVLRPEP